MVRNGNSDWSVSRSLRATDRTNAAQLRLVHSWQGLRTLRTAMTAMTAIRSQVRDAVSGLQVKVCGLVTVHICPHLPIRTKRTKGRSRGVEGVEARVQFV